MITNTALEITLTDGEHRIDSRLVARSLGIEHESLMRTISTYQTKIEKLGALRFQIGVLKYEGYKGSTRFKYVLLNENQAIFLATLSRNTDQVVEFKLQLTEAFAEVRTRLVESNKAPASQGNALFDVLVERLLLNVDQIPDGYFAVGGELLRNLALLRKKLERSTLDTLAKLDQSIGQCFLNDCGREALQAHRIRYIHLFPDGSSVKAWAYENSYLTLFTKWFWSVYMPKHFPAYERYRVRRMGLPVSRRATRKQLAGPSAHSTRTLMIQLQLFVDPENR